VTHTLENDPVFSRKGKKKKNEKKKRKNSREYGEWTRKKGRATVK